MTQPPAPPADPRPPFSKPGLILFAVYLALYAGFIYLCAFRLDWMKRPGLGGVNHATWYGFSLIVAAFVMALLYMFLARGETEERS